MAPPMADLMRRRTRIPVQIVAVLGSIFLLVIFLRPHRSPHSLIAHSPSSAAQNDEPVLGMAPATLAATAHGFVAFVSDPELQVAAIIQQTLKNEHDEAAGNDGGLVLDVGMNAGRFTLLSARLGAAVIAVEPQPACVAAVSQQLAGKELAALQPRITLLNAAIGSSAGVMQVPLSGCDPSFGVGGVARPAAATAAARQAVPVLPLSTFLCSWHRITLAKVDTEGSEVHVLQQLLPLAQGGRLGGLIVELMPGNWQARGSSTDEGVKVLQALAAAAKQTVLLTDPTPFSGLPGLRNVSVDGVPGPLYSAAAGGSLDLEQLVKERLGHDAPNEPLPHGCNVWFRFRSE